MFTRILHGIPAPRRLLLPGLLALLGTAGPATAGEPAPAADGPPAGQTADKDPAPITLDDVDLILRELGHSPRRKCDPQGVPTGSVVDLQQEGRTVPAYFTVSGGRTVWIDTDILTVDPKQPPRPEALLGILAKQDSLWPAYVNYAPRARVMQLVLTVDTFDRAGMERAIGCFAKKWASLEEATGRASSEKNPQVPAPKPVLKPSGFLVRPEGGGFEARFPEKPEGELEKVRNPIMPHLYVLETESNLHLICVQYVLGEKVHQNDEAKLDAAAQQWAEGELLSKKRTTFNAAKIPMIDMTYRNEKGYIRTWIILDGDRIFTLAYGARQQKDLDSVNCLEFLKSFRIIGSRTSNQD